MAVDFIVCCGGVGDRHGGSIRELLLLQSAFPSCHVVIVLLLLLLKPLGQGMHGVLPLCLVQLSVFLHQKDSRPRFFYMVNDMPLTRVVGMLHEVLEPAVGDGDALALGVVVAHLEALLGCIMDDVLHLLLSQRAQDAEEELTLRQLFGELLLGGEVLGEHGVLNGVLVDVLHKSSW